MYTPMVYPGDVSIVHGYGCSEVHLINIIGAKVPQCTVCMPEIAIVLGKAWLNRLPPGIIYTFKIELCLHDNLITVFG